MGRSFIVFIVLLILSGSNANATKITWTGGGTTTDWNDPLNWDLLRAPVAADSVFTFYPDDLIINTGYTARCKYFKLLGDLIIITGGSLVINNGQFDALGDVINYGSIDISNSPEEGLIFSTQATDVTFDNYGEIYVDQSGKEGFVIRNDQVFNNYGGGLIEITNSTLDNFKVDGLFNNFAVLRSGSSDNDIAISVWNNAGLPEGEINNGLCGKIVLTGKFVISDGTLNNNGFIKQNYDGQNELQGSGATVNNNAILEDIQGSFKSLDFDMQAVWLSPVGIEVNTGEPTIPMVNNLPANATFSDVYTDNLLSVNAGTYDALTNTWIPNMFANGDSTFFIEIGLSAGGFVICSDTVRFDLEAPVVETTYWLGGSGTWQFGFNWSTGSVPTSTDEVAIYNPLDDVIIPFNYTASAKNIFLGGTLTIGTLATLNISGNGVFKGIEIEEGVLINNGDLNIDGCTYGIDMLNASLTNNQDIFCTNTSFCIDIDQNSNLSATLLNTGTIENDMGDLITGDDAEITNLGSLKGNLPAYTSINSLNLINEGNIHIVGNSSATGIDAIIDNRTQGSINVENLNVGAEIEGENAGTITANMCSTGVEISDDFINQTGAEILVYDSDTGMEINDGNFINQNNATIMLRRNGQYGLYIPKPFISAGYLTNDGLIEIDTSTGIGIFCNNDITNQGEGLIEVRNSGAEGLSLFTESAWFTNKDQASVNLWKSIGNGLSIEGGQLYNKSQAKIDIDSTLSAAIFIGDFNISFNTYYGTFSNEAKIAIGPTSTVAGIHLEQGTTLTNEECSGDISNASTLDLQGSFINHGIYRHLSTLASSTTTAMINNGIVHDLNNSLTSSNMTNNGIYVIQKAGSFTEQDTIDDVLEVSPPLSTGFVIEGTWYLDKDLDLIGGQFQQNLNKLIVNAAAVDSSVFYFRTFNSNCSPNLLDTFSLKMEFPIEKICRQITWAGGKGLWTNPSNWLGGRLPGVCDSVLIDAVMDSVLLNVGDPVEIANLKNKGFISIASNSDLRVKNGFGNGIENEGTLYNQGSLIIENMIMNGYVGLPDSELLNDGSISIDNVMENGLFIDDAIVRNRVAGTLTIENVMLEELLLGMNAQFFLKGSMILND
jgi:hypothetical protein